MVWLEINIKDNKNIQIGKALKIAETQWNRSIQSVSMYVAKKVVETNP